MVFIVATRVQVLSLYIQVRKKFKPVLFEGNTEPSIPSVVVLRFAVLP